jgi:hypothetical protein
MGRDLLMKMFHRSGTENNEEADPERSSLKGNCLVGLFFPIFRVIGLEDHSVEEKCKKAEDEKELDKKDNQVLRVVLDSASGLSGDGLIDIMEIDAAGEQQDEEQNARDFLVMLIERIGDRLDLFLRNRRLQARRHGDDKKRKPADPDDRRQQMKPMIDDRDQRMRANNEALKPIHIFL